MRRLTLGVALTLVACDGLVSPGPHRERRLGVVEVWGDPIDAQVPETVAAAVPFRVSIRTWATGGCDEPGETEVSITTL